MRSWIYALVDPRQPDVYRYIGKTYQPDTRLKRHVRPTGRDAKTHRGNWIKSLHSKGLQPSMVQLFKVSTKHENEAERATIKRISAAGHPLVNGSLGGDGGALSPESLAKATATRKARQAAGLYQKTVYTQARRASISAQMRKLRSTTLNPMKRKDVRLKQAATARANLAARGYVPKLRLKMGTPEHHRMVCTRNKKTGQLYGRLISARLTGVPKTAEHVQAMRAYWANASALTVAGVPYSFLRAANLVKRDRKTIRSYANRHKLTLQQALDYYASLCAPGSPTQT